MCFRLIKSDQSPAVHYQKLCRFMAIRMKSIAINNWTVLKIFANKVLKISK
jgi:hypothetical protein